MANDADPVPGRMTDPAPAPSRRGETEPFSGGSRKGWGRWIVYGALALGAIAVLMLAGREAGGYAVRLLTIVEGMGAWAPAAFVLLYATATVALVPGALLSLAGGALFGIVRGSAFVLLGATLGSSAAFLIARYLARGRVESWIGGDRRFAAVDRAVAEDGRKVVFLLRLSPVFPFNLLNYGLGLTRIRFVDYLVASVGMVPGVVLYTYSGRVVGDVAMLAAGAPVERGPGHWAVLALGLVATAVVTVLVTRRARRALSGATG
jgi:uncharacterized membrane protein YdjX (TVP38/TMEM64 family)